MNTQHIKTRTTARLWPIVLLLLLAMALAACGGEEPGATGVQSTEVAAAPTPEEAAEEPAAEPTDAPADAPTDEPTAAPTDEPAPEPTDPPATEEPAEAAVATGECGNAFFPVVDGRTMTYSTNIDVDGITEYSTTFSNVTDSSFTFTTAFGEHTFETDWQCSEAGLLSPEASRLPNQMEGMTIEFVEAEGVTIPAEEQFQVGESWTTHYVANATITLDATTAMNTVQTHDMTHTVTAVEPISVPAGDFPEAVRVETVATIGSTIIMGDLSQQGIDIDLNYTSWYAEGVGLVRQEVEGMMDQGSAYIVELIAIE